MSKQMPVAVLVGVNDAKYVDPVINDRGKCVFFLNSYVVGGDNSLWV